LESLLAGYASFDLRTAILRLGPRQVMDIANLKCGEVSPLSEGATRRADQNVALPVIQNVGSWI